MTSGWLFLTAAGLICVAVFANGIRFARMTANPWIGRRVLGQPVSGSDWSVAKVRWLGRAQMIAAPLFLLFFSALAFGLLGPVEGIQTIKLFSE